MDQNIISIEWDYIIIGTGMGGSTIGHALAKAGKKVLFLEKGMDSESNPQALKGKFLEVLKPEKDHGGDAAYCNAGRSNLEIWDVLKKRSMKPLLGMGTGGSTALYGMTMERFWPQDFEPRKYHPKADRDCTLPEKWPISFTDLEPYYRQAEWLYGVTSTWPDPLRADQVFNYRPGPEPIPKAIRLFKALKKKGYHPYSSPLALDWVPDCEFCQSFLCAKNCKNDAVKICLSPAQKDFGATLLSECEVIRLNADERKVTSVQARYQGEEITLKGRHVILASGAIMTPLLLLQSTSNIWPNGLANRSGMVGRNLMRHYIDILMIFSRSKFKRRYARKDLALNDFYVVNNEKFGTIGSFGVLPPASMIMDDIEEDIPSGVLPFFRFMRPLIDPIVDEIMSRSGFAALMMEDLPYPENSISWQKGPNGPRVAVEYHIRPSEMERINQFRTLAKKAFLPNPIFLLGQANNLKFVAHICGTCRFGDDPNSSVLDKFNRAHDVENLHIVDSSFFPSSGGTNPGLTIAANALRVAEHLIAKDR